MEPRNRCALITGARRGLGRVLASVLAEAAQLILTRPRHLTVPHMMLDADRGGLYRQ